MLTYGEAHILVKDSMRMVKGEWVTSPLPPHRDRMKRSEATQYYKEKLKDEFIRLGYYRKKANKPQPIAKPVGKEIPEEVYNNALDKVLKERNKRVANCLRSLVGQI